MPDPIQSTNTEPRLIHFPPSTNIGSIIYNADEQTLTVEFIKSGAVYEYSMVTEELAMGFQGAASATKYLEIYVASQCPSQRIS